MDAWLGFLFVVLAGVATGTYFLGLKYVEPWKWENIWLVYAMLALLVMPLGMALATVPRLGEAFSLAPSGNISACAPLRRGLGRWFGFVRARRRAHGLGDGSVCPDRD